ncbi:hypothetical protein CQA09_29370, partial [Klebsiella pneumoniae]
SWKRNGISSIQCCSSRDDTSGKICQHTIEFKKPVYRAGSKEAAETVMDELEAKWDQQYPVLLKS